MFIRKRITSYFIIGVQNLCMNLNKIKILKLSKNVSRVTFLKQFCDEEIFYFFSRQSILYENLQMALKRNYSVTIILSFYLYRDKNSVLLFVIFLYRLNVVDFSNYCFYFIIFIIFDKYSNSGLFRNVKIETIGADWIGNL